MNAGIIFNIKVKKKKIEKSSFSYYTVGTITNFVFYFLLKTPKLYPRIRDRYIILLYCIRVKYGAIPTQEWWKRQKKKPNVFNPG